MTVSGWRSGEGFIDGKLELSLREVQQVEQSKCGES